MLEDFDLFVFDWSGVVSDDRRAVYESNVRILKEYGKPGMTFVEWLSKSSGSAVEFFKNQGVDDDSNKLAKLYKKYLDELVASGFVPIVYGDVHVAFKSLKEKGKIIAVLSSHPSENLLQEARSYGLIDMISEIVSDSRDKVKDLKLIMQKFGIVSERIVYFGDTIYDVRAAKQAGVASAAVAGSDIKQRGYHSRQMLTKENPDFILESLLGLI